MRNITGSNCDICEIYQIYFYCFLKNERYIDRYTFMFVIINKIICNCATHKRHVAQRVRLAEDPRGYWRVNKRDPCGMHLGVISSHFAPWALQRVNTFFSPRSGLSAFRV